jgi:hypothetical protein
MIPSNFYDPTRARSKLVKEVRIFFEWRVMSERVGPSEKERREYL